MNFKEQKYFGKKYTNCFIKRIQSKLGKSRVHRKVLPWPHFSNSLQTYVKYDIYLRSSHCNDTMDRFRMLQTI
jgi:hypothetical protein